MSKEINSKYDTYKSISAQSDYCCNKDVPHFAPFDGMCYKCHRNIYAPQGWQMTKFGTTPVPYDSEKADFITGITVETAKTELVTGCPRCHRTYCD